WLLLHPRQRPIRILLREFHQRRLQQLIPFIPILHTLRVRQQPLVIPLRPYLRHVPPEILHLLPAQNPLRNRQRRHLIPRRDRLGRTPNSVPPLPPRHAHNGLHLRLKTPQHLRRRDRSHASRR